MPPEFPCPAFEGPGAMHGDRSQHGALHIAILIRPSLGGGNRQQEGWPSKTIKGRP